MPCSHWQLSSVSLAAVCLFAATCLLPGAVCQPGGVAYVPGDGTSPTTVLDALQDSSVHTIMLTADHSVAEELEALTSPLLITKNLTVTSAPGTIHMLNFYYQQAKLILCSQCTVTFKSVCVSNARSGVGLEFDAFYGQPGSKIIAQDAIRMRLACTDAQSTFSIAKGIKRSQLMPNPSQEQVVGVVNVAFEGNHYPESFTSINFTADVPLTRPNGASAGGYAVGLFNVTRICKNVVPRSCLEKKSPGLCVAEFINQLLAADTAPTAANQPSPQIIALAVAVPVVVVGLLLLLLALLLRKRARRRQQQTEDPHGEQLQQNHKPDYKMQPYVLAKDVLGSMQGILDGSHTVRDIIPVDDRLPVHEEASLPLPQRPGWELVKSIVAPGVGPIKDGNVRFGVLLGAGAFGRVYSGRWADRDVAVKVIEHDALSSAAVEGEVQLMISFQHPNIVQAYLLVSYVRKDSSSHMSQRLGRAAAGGFRPQRQQQHVHSVQSPFAAVDGGNGSPDNSVVLSPVLFAKTSSSHAVSLGRVASLPTTEGEGLLDTANLHHALRSASVSGAHSRLTLQQLQHQPTRVSSETPVVETWLVQEACDCGTLERVVQYWTAGKGLEQRPEAMLPVLMLLHDAAKGLQQLHTRNVVHGDVNARNVLVSSCPASETGMIAKLGDLGVSRAVKQHETHRTTRTVGTMSHMPTETLRYGRISPAVDVYALGIMMWEVYTGQLAFPDLHYGQFYEAIVIRDMRPQVSQEVPPDYLLLMKHCWATNPSDRPSMDGVLQCLDSMIQQRLQDRQPAMAAAAAAAEGNSG